MTRSRPTLILCVNCSCAAEPAFSEPATRKAPARVYCEWCIPQRLFRPRAPAPRPAWEREAGEVVGQGGVGVAA